MMMMVEYAPIRQREVMFLTSSTLMHRSNGTIKRSDQCMYVAISTLKVIYVIIAITPYISIFHSSLLIYQPYLATTLHIFKALPAGHVDGPVSVLIIYTY